MKEKNILKDLKTSITKLHKIYAHRHPCVEDQQELINSNLELISLLDSLLSVAEGGEMSAPHIVGYLCYLSDHLWEFSPSFGTLAERSALEKLINEK